MGWWYALHFPLLPGRMVQRWPRTRPKADTGGKGENAPKEALDHDQGTMGDVRTEVDAAIRRTSRAAVPRFSPALGRRTAPDTRWE